MKHIVRRFIREQHLDNFNKSIASEVRMDDPDLLKKSTKYKSLFLEATDGSIVDCFPVNYKGKNAIIPIPDLSIVYFNSAQILNKLRNEAETKMFNKLTVSNGKVDHLGLEEIYIYFGHASGCIIYLFTAMESFINNLLPDNAIYTNISTQKTEIFNKEQIQRNIQFDDKVKKVLPQLLKKSFFKHQTTHTQSLTDLKKIRDDIVHTKSSINFKEQSELMKKMINFKYEHAFTAVAKFINFYKEDHILECPCDKVD